MILAQPSNVDCAAWDQAYIAVAHTSVWGVLLSSAVAGLAVGYLLGGRSWVAAAPRARVLVAAGTVLSIALVAVVAWPAFGLGTAWFSGVPPNYLGCRGLSFGAQGFLGGLIGSGVPAITQVPAVIGLQVAAAALGSASCLGISTFLARRGSYSSSSA